jgi:hypothetical protein
MNYLEQRKDKQIAELEKVIKEMRDESPDPRNWELLEEFQRNASGGPLIALKLRYPKCKNYKGEKVLVFRATLSQLVKQKVIDPHFGDINSTKIEQPEDMIYPIARFPASVDGWNDAVKYVMLK